MSPKNFLNGQIVAAFGRQYLVRLASGEELICVPRGKKSEVVCGDQVSIQRTNDAQDKNGALGVIEKISERHSLLYRSDAFRTKLIAANVDQLIIVVAAEPSFSDELLTRCLIAAQHQHMHVLIILNKCDLQQAAENARRQLQPYAKIGYEIIELSAKQNATALLPHLQNRTSVLVGQSGMGKSTLINALLPNAQAATREISSALDSGKHTTTHARLYLLNEHSALIDCPGVQAFGLNHLSLGEIEQGFVEFNNYLGKCRFHNCRHLHEPGCVLREASLNEQIHPRRLELFQQITTQK